MKHLKIKRLRESKKISQKKMGALCGIAEQTYALIENGKTDTSVSTIEKIAEILGVDITFFFTPEKSYAVAEESLSIVAESTATYGSGCKKCNEKDYQIELVNKQLRNLIQNNEALIKTNETLNKCIDKLSGEDKSKEAV